MRILLASRNAGKLREFAELLPGADLVPWPASAPEIPEDGAFFQDNALQKATFARAWWDGHGGEAVDGVLADDSGLCVDALWGGPGVLSARFAKGLAQDAKNRRLLELVPEGAPRTARFVCVLAWIPREGAPRTFSGSVEGRLALEPRGSGGFGYDPLFAPEGFDLTFGELGAEVKHGLSHRGRAARAFLAFVAPGALLP
ncbi:MAG TPA: non-canonical purine NTP pyrophosphatase [Holophaga sp.]|nr:non-canonical purine NTP pyrophosphatase [Holophaga sp.]